jgi:hypothetical protein
MSSYAAIASLPAPVSTVVTAETKNSSANAENPIQKEVIAWLLAMKQVEATAALKSAVAAIRSDLESPPVRPRTQAPPLSNFGGPSRNFGSSAAGGGGGWRNNSFQTGEKHFTNRSESSMHSKKPAPAPTPYRPAARYKSCFVNNDNINSKILNTVIGNKLNSFTAKTYNDTRDFIYQIIDSGETEFTKDFIEKVFKKAATEELYCSLFAKLIAEIAVRYPIMYTEMNRYHGEFLKVFDDVHEGGEEDYAKLLKQKQYRLGYGQFISDLASNNALGKEQLLTMVSKVIDKITALSLEKDKENTVEEFIDCLVRLTKSLREKTPKFFVSVQEELKTRIISITTDIIATKAQRPSLSTKARFGLMDLNDFTKDNI